MMIDRHRFTMFMFSKADVRFCGFQKLSSGLL